MGSLPKLLDGDSPSIVGLNATSNHINMDNTSSGGCRTSPLIGLIIIMWVTKHYSLIRLREVKLRISTYRSFVVKKDQN